MNSIDIGTPTRSASRRWRFGLTLRSRAVSIARHSPWSKSARRSRRSWSSRKGRLVDASAGTRGPIGLRSQGSWDGEVAYWRSPLTQERLVPRRRGRPGRSMVPTRFANRLQSTSRGFRRSRRSNGCTSRDAVSRSPRSPRWSKRRLADLDRRSCCRTSRAPGSNTPLRALRSWLMDWRAADLRRWLNRCR